MTPGPMGDFHRGGGDALLWTGLDIGPGDVVVDGGGYLGEWTARVLECTQARVEVFEPIPAFADAIRGRFAEEERVAVVKAGLGGEPRVERIALAGDASGFFSAGGEEGARVDVRVEAIGEVLARHPEIACLKLNIEGAEFEVLEAMIASDLLRRVRYVLIQFHGCVPSSEARRERIQAVLAQTHDKRFDFPFIWERWDRR